MQMSGTVKRALPPSQILLLVLFEWIFVLFFFYAPEHLTVSFSAQHFPLILATASHLPKLGIVSKIIIVTRKCQQHALFGCHSPLTGCCWAPLWRLLCPCRLTGPALERQGLPDPAATLLMAHLSSAKPQTLLLCDLINGTKASSQHLFVN